ncbi:MAG: ABC transporter substrate-binding protein [Oscillospiraceae bacterium]|nr:ABC transporter substrate-binding protein [Oscillospiraceae bacterium]
MKKLCIGIICLLVLCLSGCSRGAEDPNIQERIVLGFSQLGSESEWRIAASNDIRRAAEEADIQLIFDNAQQQQFNQIRAIRSFILKGVDVIAFSPIVEDGWDNILEEARVAGIPVIVVDRKIETAQEDLYAAFIGADFHGEGVRAGEWMVERFARAEGPIRIAEISGTPYSSPTIGRYEGLREVLRDYPQFEIVISHSGDFMRSKGRESMEFILQGTPDIDILFSHNDDMALGAIEIMKERGIRPGIDIAVVSVDAQASGLVALRQGQINCLIECSPYAGDLLMELISNIVNGRPFVTYTYTETRVFTDRDDFYALPVQYRLEDIIVAARIEPHYTMRMR